MSSAAEGRRPTEASPSSPQGSFGLTAFLISNLHGFLTIMIYIFNEHNGTKDDCVCVCVFVCVCVLSSPALDGGADSRKKVH